METRHLVEGYFGSEFPASCNHCRVMAAWTGKTLKKFEIFFCVFLEKRLFAVKFSKLFWKFLSPHRSTCCVQILWNLTSGKSVKSYVIYLTKNLPGFPAVATARIAPKICQGQPLSMYAEFSRFHPNQFTFGGVMDKRVNTAKTRRKVNPIFGWSLASSRIMIDIWSRK